MADPRLLSHSQASTSAPHAPPRRQPPPRPRPHTNPAVRCRAEDGDGSAKGSSSSSSSRGSALAERPAPPQQRQQQQQKQDTRGRWGGLGDILGPIGLTLGGALKKEEPSSNGSSAGSNGNGSSGGSESNGAGVPLPHSLAGAATEAPWGGRGEGESGEGAGGSAAQQPSARSIHSMDTAEWRSRYEADGYVDLWVEEEFNAGSRLMGGRDTFKGAVPGAGSGEGPTGAAVKRHTVRITNHYAGQEVEVEVPEDRYILWEAEAKGLLLPYACRMGCCTACAVRVKEGELYQPQSLGVAQPLRDAGYGLMCVGYARSDLVLETVPEDEVYDLQFGEAFEAQAVDPANRQSILRDDYALEIAQMDE